MTKRPDRTFQVLRRCLLLVSVLFIAFPLFSFDGFNIVETFKDDTTESFSFGGDPVAYLTSGKVDPKGDGWLRLTSDEEYQKGYAILKKSFPSNLGVLIDLEFKTWRINDGTTGAGADGFSVFLFDALASPFNIGGFGGSLGYAPYILGLDNYPGLSGGYFGVGFDEYGNFSNGSEGRNGGIGRKANTIGIRGPAAGNYNWLTGITPPEFTLQYQKTTKRPDNSTYYRRFQILISPVLTGGVKSYTISVKAKTDPNGSFQTLLASYTMPSLPPDSLRLGFAASTGDDVNFHEVRNLYITTTGGLRITKSVDKTLAREGDELTYTLDLFNQTKDTLRGLHLNDDLNSIASWFNVSSIQFDSDGDALNTVSYSGLNLSSASVNMGPMSHASFTIMGTVKDVPTSHQIVNTAVFNAGTSGYVDGDLTNDTATISTTILDPRIALIKKASSKTFTNSGEEIQYTFEVHNTGYGILTDLTLSDPMLTNPILYVSGDTNGDGKLDMEEVWIYKSSYVTSNLDVTNKFVENSAVIKALDLIGNEVADTSGTTIDDNDPTVVTLDNETFIPNVFTPNGDGINDVFEIVGLKLYSNVRLLVYNRWGNQVYRNDKYNNDWSGDGLNEGTYYYILFLSKDSETKRYSGWVLLKR
jgi:gliding motility-associated-like protein/uncharacterized repeat protein (TIGR01451 family)